MNIRKMIETPKFQVINKRIVESLEALENPTRVDLIETIEIWLHDKKEIDLMKRWVESEVTITLGNLVSMYSRSRTDLKHEMNLDDAAYE